MNANDGAIVVKIFTAIGSGTLNACPPTAKKAP